MITDQFEGKVIGLANAHPKDTLWHDGLLDEATNRGAVVLDMVHATTKTTDQGTVRLGERSLAQATVDWVLDNGVDVLVTITDRSHVEHDAAASIGRLAAAMLWHGEGYSLNLLERQQKGHEHPGSIWFDSPGYDLPASVPNRWAPQEVRTAEQPLLLSDFMGAKPRPHFPPDGRAAYRFIPAGQLVFVQNRLATRATLNALY